MIVKLRTKISTAHKLIKLVLLNGLLVIGVSSKLAFAMPDFFLLSPLITAGNSNNLNGEVVPVLSEQTFNIEWVVENSSTTSGTSQVRHYISVNNDIVSASDIFLGSTTVSNSSFFFGISQDLVMPSTVPSGTFSVGSCYPVSGGTRCSKAGNVRVTSGPVIDLLSPLLSSRGINNINAMTLAVPQNSNLNISWILENSGGASNNIKVEHYISLDRTITRGDTLFGSQTLAVEEGTPLFSRGLSFSASVGFTQGRYFVGTCTIPGDCSFAGQIDVVDANISANLPAVFQLLFGGE